MSRVLLVVLAVTIGSVPACGPSDDAAVGATSLRVVGADTLVTSVDGAIGIASDLRVADDGRLWIADRQNHVLHVFDPAGADAGLVHVGREGDGPGELRAPTALGIAGGSVSSLQPRAARLTTFTFDGSHASSQGLPGGLVVPSSLAADSLVAYPSLGLDGSLVTRLNARSGERTMIGQAYADRPGGMSMSSIRDQALRGEFPIEFQNNVTPVVAPDGRVWFVGDYRGVVAAYSATGDSLWSRSLDRRVLELAHARYFQAVEDDPNRVRVPAVVRDVELVGDELWIAISNDGAGSQLHRMNARTGAPLGTIDMPGLNVGQFAATNQGDGIYYVDPDVSALISISLVEAGARDEEPSSN